MPCLFCGHEHRVSCSSKAFLYQKALAFSCAASGLDCCYAGEEAPVFAAMKRLEEAVDKLEELLVVRECYDQWCILQNEVENYCHDKPRERKKLAQEKKFRQIKNAIIQEAENIRLGVMTFEDEKVEDRDEWVENWEVSYECLRLRGRIEDNKLPLAQRDEAAEDLAQLSESGDVHAHYFLGLLYRDGGLLLPDAEQATHWLALAAKRNLPEAQYALGKLYLSDDPEVHDTDNGIQWLERAAQNGNTDAAYRLGAGGEAAFLRRRFSRPVVPDGIGIIVGR